MIKRKYEKIYKEYKKNGITKVNSLISEKNIQDIIKFIKDLFINFLKKKKKEITLSLK